ncbi:hypothetical protein GCM10007159_23730 [Modicisalibacter luteus]|jgi:hypothetical protein|nr:hypothetical protein GCM10007159_23730 [Halomonas lutea]
MFEKYEVVSWVSEDSVERPPAQGGKEVFLIRDKALDSFLPGRFESLSEARDCCYQLNNDRP